LKKIKLILAFTLFIALISLVATAKAQTGVTDLTIYGGSVTSGSGTYGFGNSADNIVSPGPDLNLTVGTTYKMTFYNVANIPHSWEISQTKAVGAAMFGAGIDVNSYVSPGQSGSATFTPDQAGDFYYVCTVPGHIELGMWGNVHIEPAIPEFPSTIILVVAGLAITIVAVSIIRLKTNSANNR
jgi:plastocyanin